MKKQEPRRPYCPGLFSASTYDNPEMMTRIQMGKDQEMKLSRVVAMKLDFMSPEQRVNYRLWNRGSAFR